jgi:hypothetical protein
MEEQTKMEKNKATRYMPTQKKKEFQPPMAESVDFGFMDIKLVFQKGFLSAARPGRKIPRTGIVSHKNSSYY